MKIKVLIVAAMIVVLSIITWAVVGNKDNGQTDVKGENTSSMTITSDAVIIDVRTPQEYSVSHATEAINFDLVKLESGELPTIDKDKEIYVYCRSGRRSDLAKTILEKNGFTNVTDIGGLDDLGKHGLQLVGNS